MGNVVVVGSSNTDMVFGCSGMPKPGETITGKSFDIFPGGKGANQAVAAARAGASVTFIARVGNDHFGKKAIQDYSRDNINTSFISTDPDLPSGTAMIMVDETGQNSIVVVPGANGNLRPEDIDKAEEVFRDADILLLQLEIPLNAVEHALKLAKKYGVLTILNPAPAVKLDTAILSLVDLITPNETETSLLTGIFPQENDTLNSAADHLHHSVRNVIITIGEKGAFLSTGETASVIPAEQVKAQDTTAAGDVFNGYLAAALAQGKTLQEATKMANKAACLSVQKKGAQPSIPYYSELNQ